MGVQRNEKFTEHWVRGVKPAVKSVEYWDEEGHGLGLRVSPRGKKVFIVDYRVGGKHPRRNIGEWRAEGQVGGMSVKEARKLAQKVTLAARDGMDVLASRSDSLGARRVEAAAELGGEAESKTITTGEAVGQYKPVLLGRILRGELSSDWHKETLRILDGRIIAAFGSKGIAEITKSDVESWHRRLGLVPAAANHALAVLKRLLDFASEKGWLGAGRVNPAVGVKKFPIRSRHFKWDESHLSRLATFLADAEKTRLYGPSTIPVIRMLIVTGCRLGEVMKLKWSQVDRDRQELRWGNAQHKTFMKTGEMVKPLSEQAFRIIEHMEQFRLPENPYVFVREDGEGHVTEIKKVWQRMRTKLSLVDEEATRIEQERLTRLLDLAEHAEAIPVRIVRAKGGDAEVAVTRQYIRSIKRYARIHDLRHRFGDACADQGLNQAQIMSLMGHRTLQASQRYVRGTDAVHRQNADKVADLLAL